MIGLLIDSSEFTTDSHAAYSLVACFDHYLCSTVFGIILLKRFTGFSKISSPINSQKHTKYLKLAATKIRNWKRETFFFFFWDQEKEKAKLDMAESNVRLIQNITELQAYFIGIGKKKILQIGFSPFLLEGKHNLKC